MYRIEGYMINKGRIQMEIKNFLMYSSKLIKSDEKLTVEIEENDILRKITSKKIHRIKNHRKWSWFRGEIEVWSVEKFSDVKIAILAKIRRK